MKDYKGEKVLVVKRALFDELGSFQGSSDNTDQYLPSLINAENYFFMDRGEAENDPAHKQLIPYCLFRYQDQILHYVRGASGGESRLHAKGSIGIGGHINPIDEENGQSTYEAAVQREIEEELIIEGTYTSQIVGLINDEENEVGKVHLGVVHLIDLETNKVTAGEDSQADLKFIPISELRTTYFEQLESWSQFALELVKP